MGGEPIAYAVDAASGPPVDLTSLQRSLVFRGDAPYMVVLEPGQLTVFSLGAEILSEATPRAKLTVRHDEANATTTFQRLFHAPEPLSGTMSSQVVHERLFKLLSETVDELVGLNLDRNDALSLAGRAMFTRFLVDRSILLEDEWPNVARRADRPDDFFATPTNAASTCRWLDTTFNGDFLPLSFQPTRSILARFPRRVLENLSDIMRCRRGRQLFFQWENVDLSNVPAGLLSQVYEHQAEHWNPYSRHRKGVYYTPRRIADYMVGEVMASVRSERAGGAADIRVLDPAVGGGVFLVAFFRELVSERWRQLGRAPNSEEIRAILYEQLAGFDITEPALRLTALSLYLTALELDSDPQPLSSLRFEPLRDRVLFDVTERAAVAGGSVLGSLRSHPEHSSKFDVVIANPPWTALTGSVRRTEREINTVVGEKRVLEEPVRLPDKVPDIGFLWCSSSWAKPDGWIAMALHARLLFKQSEVGVESRNALFANLDITGILNGSELRMTDVWPEMDAPFCLLFARNRLPTEASAFYFVSPSQEQGMNAQGRFRVDAASAQPVSTIQLAKRPTLLKTLFRGTALDESLLRHVEDVSSGNLASYWSGLGLCDGQGYQVGTSRAQDAQEIQGLPDIGSHELPDPVVSLAGFPGFGRNRIHRVRDPRIYKGPVVLVRKSPPTLRRRKFSRASAITFKDAAYSESFYGWSTHGHSSPELLAKYLFVLLNSDLFLWHCLVTSSEFGVERESIHKHDVDSFPVVSFDSLSRTLKSSLEKAFDTYKSDPSETTSLNDVVSDVYRLSGYQQEVVRDTLSMRLPYRDNIEDASHAPSDDEVDSFAARLAAMLDQSLDKKMEVRVLNDLDLGPWLLLLIGRPVGLSDVPAQLRRHLRLADQAGASRVLVRWERDKVLGVCSLRRRRYWTQSRARLLALELLRNHATLWQA